MLLQRRCELILGIIVYDIQEDTHDMFKLNNEQRISYIAQHQNLPIALGLKEKVDEPK